MAGRAHGRANTREEGRAGGRAGGKKCERFDDVSSKNHDRATKIINPKRRRKTVNARIRCLKKKASHQNCHYFKNNERPCKELRDFSVKKRESPMKIMHFN